LDPDERSEANVTEILEFVKDVKFFPKLTVLQQRALCRRMKIEVFGPREFVFQIGEVGNKFYIILTGGVGVQAMTSNAPCPNGIHTTNCDCPNRAVETIVFLEKGMGFGELALQSDTPRSATIVTSERTELLVTTREDYEKYAGQLHRQFLEQRVRFLRQCPRIEDALQRCLVSTQDIAAMANCLNESSLRGNEIVVRQGEPVDHMIFVRSGQLAMVRVVDADASRPSQRRDLSRNLRGASQPGDAAGPKRRALKLPLNKRGASEGEDAAQKGAKDDAVSPKTLSCNIAKLLMDLRSEDRAERLNAMLRPPKNGAKIEAKPDVASEAPGVSKKSPPTLKVPGLASSSGSSPRATSASEARKSSTGSREIAAPPTGKGKTAWAKLRHGMKQAMHLRTLIEQKGAAAEGKGETNLAANLEHFQDVQGARRRCLALEKKGLAEKRRSFLTSSKAKSSHVTKVDEPPPPPPLPKRRLLLRIGTISPFQYFGDQQLGNNDFYPVSLVSDPVAEIYMITKHDILRRLPKKLFAALFTVEQETVPSDAQLLDMHRQTQRWDSFRLGMHGKASNSARLAGLSAQANLEFLGIAPGSPRAVPQLPPRRTGAALTPKDEEHFSQAPARFLRHFDIMRKDQSLRNALAKDGLHRRKHISDCLSDSEGDDPDKDERARDPMSFYFDLHWAKLRKPSLLGVREDNAEESPPPTSSRIGLASPSRRQSLARRGSLLAMASGAFIASGRRHGTAARELAIKDGGREPPLSTSSNGGTTALSPLGGGAGNLLPHSEVRPTSESKSSKAEPLVASERHNSKELPPIASAQAGTASPKVQQALMNLRASSRRKLHSTN